MLRNTCVSVLICYLFCVWLLVFGGFAVCVVCCFGCLVLVLNWVRICFCFDFAGCVFVAWVNRLLYSYCLLLYCWVLIVLFFFLCLLWYVCFDCLVVLTLCCYLDLIWLLWFVGYNVLIMFNCVELICLCLIVLFCVYNFINLCLVMFTLVIVY